MPSDASCSNAAAEPETPHERWFLRHVLPRLRTSVSTFKKPPSFLGSRGDVDLTGLQVGGRWGGGAFIPSLLTLTLGPSPNSRYSHYPKRVLPYFESYPNLI